MLQIGDRIRVKAKTGGPDIAPHLARFRLKLWGAEGVIADITPQIERPIVALFQDTSMPGAVRFWPGDLLRIG